MAITRPSPQKAFLVRIGLTLQETGDALGPRHLPRRAPDAAPVWHNAELEPAQCADRMLGRGDREKTLTWFRIWRTIAAMRQAPTDLPP